MAGSTCSCARLTLTLALALALTLTLTLTRQHLLVRKAVEMGIERKGHDRELISQLLSRLFEEQVHLVRVRARARARVRVRVRVRVRIRVNAS